MAMSTTSDPEDPRLTRGADPPDASPKPQAQVYLVLSEEERAKGLVRPVRNAYVHTVCGHITTMSRDLAETYARDPGFYGATYCTSCGQHRPVGEEGEFVWLGTNGVKVGT
jgi:hypothetical protein